MATIRRIILGPPKSQQQGQKGMLVAILAITWQVAAEFAKVAWILIKPWYIKVKLKIIEYRNKRKACH